jgi:hypothetical protein
LSDFSLYEALGGIKMTGSWKSVLYEYVQKRNQMEVDYQMESVLPYVSDENYVLNEKKRLKRIIASDRKNARQPVRSETRVKVNKISEREDKVVVDITFMKKKTMPAGPDEERLEKERLTLVQVSRGWTIKKVDVAVPERISQVKPLNDIPAKNDAAVRSGGRREEPSGLKAAGGPFLNPDVLSARHMPTRNITYNRMKAKQYADTWWNQGNPEFIEFDVDCTNYVSQCLYAGGIPMNYTGNRASGWWYKGRIHGQEQWSFSWSVSHSLQSHLSTSRSGLRAELVESPKQLTIGDVIIYDWDGDSRYQHSTIVTEIDAAGYPLVNAHTSNSRHRYWDYKDSYAWSEKTKYRFFHIVDSV